MSDLEIAELKKAYTVHECPRCGLHIPIIRDDYSFNKSENSLKDEYILNLESLVRDMMELDKTRHMAWSWDRYELMQDMRYSINARLIKMGFVKEVDS